MADEEIVLLTDLSQDLRYAARTGRESARQAVTAPAGTDPSAATSVTMFAITPIRTNGAISGRSAS